MKKIVFLDIDGTLVTPNYPLSDFVKKGIKKARENGHLIFLCTGRNRIGIESIMSDDFDGCICSAGGYLEIKGEMIETTYLDKEGKIRTANKIEHEFEYRMSRFAKNKNEIIIESIIELKKGNKAEIKQKMEDDKRSRKLKQPLNYPNAGSVFKRGNDYITAMLIDKCGLKGYNVGDAYVSDLHAGFIVNKGNATAKDVLELIEYIKKRVYEEFNKKIELEIEIVGED